MKQKELAGHYIIGKQVIYPFGFCMFIYSKQETVISLMQDILHVIIVLKTKLLIKVKFICFKNPKRNVFFLGRPMLVM